MKLSIIIPVYNEENTIEHVLDAASKVKLPDVLQRELIVINDGSVDRSEERLLRFRKNIRYFRHKKNLGKGAAVRTGLEMAKGDIVLIQDADLEYNPIYYSNLLEPILKSNIPVVYGTRLTTYPLKLWGKNKTVLPINLLANKFLTFLTNLLYGSNLTDMETGYKLFSKDALNNISIKSNKFDFEAEITAKLLKNKITILEIPISVKPRTYEEGKKIGFSDGISATWTLIKYRFIN